MKIVRCDRCGRDIEDVEFCYDVFMQGGPGAPDTFNLCQACFNGLLSYINRDDAAATIKTDKDGSKSDIHAAEEGMVKADSVLKAALKTDVDKKKKDRRPFDIFRFIFKPLNEK